MATDLVTAPPTSEVLRERDPAPATTPDTPKTEQPLSLIDIAQRSEDAYAELKAQMPKFQARVEAQQEQAGAASQVAEQAHQQLVQPAIARMVQASRAPLPEVPKALPQPAVPDIKPRPFMDVKGKDALGGVVQMLGVMAQMAMAGKAPVGALNALTGAMNGWSEGDHERAQREWRQYLVTVDNIRQENFDNMARWEAAMKTHGANQTAAQAEYIGMLAEQKHYDAIAQVAREGMPSAWQQLQAVQAEADKVRKQTMDLLHLKSQEDLKRLMLESQMQARQETNELKRLSMAQHGEEVKARLAETAQHNRAMEDIGRQNTEIKTTLASQKTGDRQQGYQTMVSVLNDMDALATRLAQKKLIPDDSGVVSTAQAWANRKLSPNDSDWRQWQALQGAMVGYERTVYNDKGARALATYKSLLDFVDHPPTEAGAHAIIKRMQGYLEQTAPGGAVAPKPSADFTYDAATGKLVPVK